MINDNDFIKENLDSYIKILLEERAELGKDLNSYLNQNLNDNETQVKKSLLDEMIRLEREIKELLFINKFKKELLTER